MNSKNPKNSYLLLFCVYIIQVPYFENLYVIWFWKKQNWIKNSSLTLNFCGDSFPPPQKKHLPWCLCAWSSILCNNQKEFIKLNNFWFQWRVDFFFYLWLNTEFCTIMHVCQSSLSINIFILLRNRSVLGNKTWGSVLKLLVLLQKTLILQCYILIPLP